MLLNVYSILGSAASFFGLLFTLRPLSSFSYPEYIFSSLTVALLILSLFTEIRRQLANRVRTYPSGSPKITQYMKQWLRAGGRCAVFTRDMTWASDAQITELLIAKAKSDEISIFCPIETPFIRELRLVGADIFTYGDLDINPRSRFTVMHWQQDGARVAVGRPVKGRHVIHEYSAGEHPSP